MRWLSVASTDGFAATYGILSIPAKEFDFADIEVALPKAAIETWGNYGANSDRRWLEPLLMIVVGPQPG
jgi:hypothetical protein